MSRHSKWREYLQNICTRLQDLQVTPLLVYVPTWDTTIVIYRLLFLMRKLKLRYVGRPSFLVVWKQWLDVNVSLAPCLGQWKDREHAHFSSLRGLPGSLSKERLLGQEPKGWNELPTGSQLSLPRRGGLQRLTYWSTELGRGVGWPIRVDVLQVEDSMTQQELPGY